MKRTIAGFSTAALLCLLPSTPASADVLYSNGPVNGTLNAWSTSFTGYVTADSFTLSSNSTLTGVADIGFWVFLGDTPLSEDWSIWSAAGPGGGGTELYGPTTASLINTFDFANEYDIFDVYTSSFSLPSIALDAGTYWLQLGNGTTFLGSMLAWDQNNGPTGNGTGSQAWTSGEGFITAASDPCVGAPASGYCSESFEIVGTSSIPEPSSVYMLGSLLVLVLFLLHQKTLR